MEFLEMSLENMLLGDSNFLGDDRLKRLIEQFLREPLPLPSEKVQEENALLCVKIGERLVLNEEYNEAISMYTKGLQISLPFSMLSFKFYYHRSNALDKLKLYKESLLDIDRALKFPVPTEALSVLQNKKAKIQENMARAKSAKTNDKGVSKSFLEIPNLSDEENKDVPGASNAIRAMHDSEYGRHLVATKSIKLGDVILIEKPFLTYPLPNAEEMCHHCLESCKAPIPCDYCNSALFCSEDCRKEAYDAYHKNECIYSTCSNNIRASLRFLLILTDNGAKLEEAKEFAKELDAKDDLKDPRAAYVSGESNLQSILSLSSLIKKRASRDYQVHSAALATMLRNYSNYMNGSNDVLNVARLILRLACIIKTYSIALNFIHDKNPSAIGLYPLFSAVCHSCCGNTIYSIHKGNVLALRATKDIEAGEKITYNFLGPAVVNLSSPERRDIILAKRNTICKCQACMSNYDFKPELRKRIAISEQLKRRLRKCPTDVPNMWEVLKLIHNDIKRPCLEMELLKVAISEAYMSKESSVIWSLYNGIGIL